MFKKIVLSIGLLAAAVAPATLQANAFGGPQIDRSSVAGYSRIRYKTIYFVGGETAYVQANGDESTNLQLTVYDNNGNLINQVTGPRPWIRWTPRWSGSFTVYVENMGGSTNDYVLRTN
jgi:hypothetical protein